MISKSKLRHIPPNFSSTRTRVLNWNDSLSMAEISLKALLINTPFSNIPYVVNLVVVARKSK